MKKPMTTSVTFLAVLGCILAPAHAAIATPTDQVNPPTQNESAEEEMFAGEGLIEPLAAKAPAAPVSLAAKPNYSSVKNLALSLSYPLFEAGQKPHPASYTGGGPVDRDLAAPAFYAAKERARSEASKAGNSSLPYSKSAFANCSAFTATVIVNTVDASFPGNLVSNQVAYVENPSNGWKKIATSETYNPKDLKPGDLFLHKYSPDNPSTSTGHTWMWIGDYGGVKDVVAEASYGKPGSSSARLPALRIDPIQTSGKPGKDRIGRVYDVWRFQGKPKPAKPTVTVGKESGIGVTDFNRDGLPDLFAVKKGSGELFLYKGKPQKTPGLAGKKQIGNGWQNMRIITAGDFNGDGNADLVATNAKTGELWLYPGTSKGTFSARKSIGKGFTTIRDIMSPGDFNGDGRTDLVGVHKKTKKLIMWPGNGKGGFLTKKEIGHGWQNMSIASGADLNGDGRADILARNDKTGELFLYPGDGKGGFKTRVKIGNGWKGYEFLSIGDLTGSGNSDIIARENATGKLWLYEVTKGLKVGARIQIGYGWNTLQQIQ